MKIFEIIVNIALVFICSLFSIQSVLYIALSQYKWIYEMGFKKADSVVLTLLFMISVFALTIFILTKFKNYIYK